MYAERLEKYKQIEQLRDSKLLVYITGDRPGLETQISSEVLDYFAEQLDRIGVVNRISLFLYTRGGDTLTGWSLINLIRQFGDDFEVIVPSKAHSTGTIICLGADRIIMTKQAMLSPIDPSINSPLNPQIPGAPIQNRLPVSVEDIQGYIEMMRSDFGIKDEAGMASVLNSLSQQVHPLVLGSVQRSKNQIQSIAERLLSRQIKEKAKVKEIVSFLCRDSGSHDYTINRREAKESLNLSVEKPSEELYGIIKEVYSDIRTELQLGIKYDPIQALGGTPAVDYRFTRGMIESIRGGSDLFVSEGKLTSTNQPQPNGIVQTIIQDNRSFEGWRHTDAPN